MGGGVSTAVPAAERKSGSGGRISPSLTSSAKDTLFSVRFLTAKFAVQASLLIVLIIVVVIVAVVVIAFVIVANDAPYKMFSIATSFTAVTVCF